jgi:hypothetical protein
MPVLSSPSKEPSDTCPACKHESIQGSSNIEKEYRTSRAGDLDPRVQLIFSKALSIEASQQLMIRESQPPDFTPLSPQPCQVWHDYRGTNAHNDSLSHHPRRMPLTRLARHEHP